MNAETNILGAFSRSVGPSSNGNGDDHDRAPAHTDRDAPDYDDETTLDESWQPVDLGPILAGEHVQPVPDWLLRNDGHALRSGMADRLLDMAQLRSLPVPEPLIGSLFDLDTLALLYGRRGSYKSFLALDWALHIAYGRRWHTQTVHQGHVLYVCAEGSHGLSQRIDAWKSHHGVLDDTSRLAVLPEAVNLMAPASSGALADVAASIGACLVILDTWARCTVGGEENSTKDMGLAIEQLDVIRRRSGACVLGVHHAGKDTTAGARGSSALEAAFDTVFEIAATDDVVTLKSTKQKHHPEGNPWHLRAVPAEASVALDLNHTSGGEEWTASDNLALHAFADIETTSGVSFTAWKVAAHDAGVSEATVNRTRKKALDRAVIGLESTSTHRAPRYVLTEAGRCHLAGVVE